jgi:hypothetical protein
MVKKPTITETIRLHRLRWFGHVQRMEENIIPKGVLSMKLEATRPRGRPRNRWQDDVSENGRRRVAGKSIRWGRMEEAPLNGKESPHSAHANGMNEYTGLLCTYSNEGIMYRRLGT